MQVVGGFVLGLCEDKRRAGAGGILSSFNAFVLLGGLRSQVNRFGIERTAGDIVIRVVIESPSSRGLSFRARASASPSSPSDSELMRTPSRIGRLVFRSGLMLNRQMRI